MGDNTEILNGNPYFFSKDMHSSGENWASFPYYYIFIYITFIEDIASIIDKERKVRTHENGTVSNNTLIIQNQIIISAVILHRLSKFEPLIVLQLNSHLLL